MLEFLNIFFFVFHTAWMIFNTVGWAWRQTRPYHLVTMSLTAISWFVLGIWYGFGYCVCTDWHWQVRRQLGIVDDDRSYVHLLIHKLIGLDLSYLWTDIITGTVFGIAFLLSIILNIHDWKRHRARDMTSPQVP